MLIPTYPKSTILHVIALAFVFSQSMMIASESTNSAQQKCPSTTVASKSTNTTQQGLDNHALVIAIGEYSNGWERWADLPAVYEDAKRIEEALGHQWKITVAKDLEIDCLKQVIENFFRPATGTQRLLLYYAGHGFAHFYREPNSPGGSIRKVTAHLIPSNVQKPTSHTYSGNSSYDEKALPVEFVLNEARKSKAKEVLAVFDVCMLSKAVYTNFNLNLRNKTKSLQRKNGSSRTVNRSGTAASSIFRGFITSGYAANEAFSKSNFNSAFAGALRKMEGRDSKIDVDKLYDYLIHLHQKSFDPQFF